MIRAPCKRLYLTIALIGAITLGVHAQQQARSNEARSAGAGRIMHGEFIKAGQAPWAVSIRMQTDPDDPNSSGHFCGGSLFSPVLSKDLKRVVSWRHDDTKPRWVVTAAHCVVNDEGHVDPTLVKSMSILGGSLDRKPEKGGEVQDVIDAIPHSDYDRFRIENDIALLYLASPTKDPDRTLRSSIRLPSISDTFWINEPYLAVYAQGWGATETGSDSLYLKEVLLPVVARELCQQKFGIHGWQIDEGMLCAGFTSGNFDSCQGDSGGPLVYRSEGQYATASRSRYPVLVGVVSWGLGCGSADLFGVYTSVAYYREWIEQQVVKYMKSQR